MTTDIVEVKNFIVLIEQSSSKKTIVQRCFLEENAIGLSFYKSGEVELKIQNGIENIQVVQTSGNVSSFYGDNKTQFIHSISNTKPLKCISIFITLNNLKKLPKQELELFSTNLDELINRKKGFTLGPHFFMTPDMQNAVSKIFNNKYNGTTRIMFIQSQAIELITHFFALCESSHQSKIKPEEKTKLYKAKDIISNNLEAPPTLGELSKLIGLNNYKLKKLFKELFGIPVYKYLQHERLDKAHELIIQGEMNIQQIAMYVGYESLSSFSKAFLSKFGYRPSKVKT